MQYDRGIPIVPLADVGSADVTIGDVVAASQLAAEETGWPETLLPAPRTWRVTAPSGDVRIIWGMPFLEAITSGPVAAADNNAIVEARISSAGVQSIGHVSGFGWLEPSVELANSLSATATAVPDVGLAAGEVLLVGSELVWHDGTGLVRERPAVHPATTPLRRVRAQASLALAVTRIAKRAADARARAGAARRRGPDEGPFVVLDADSRRALAPFRRPSTTWLQALPAADIAGGTIGGGDGGDAGDGASLDEVLAAILEGANITIDRGNPDEITINAGQSIAGRGNASWLARATFDEVNNNIDFDIGEGVTATGDVLYWDMPVVGSSNDPLFIMLNGVSYRLEDRDANLIANSQVVHGRIYNAVRVYNPGAAARGIRLFETLAQPVSPLATYTRYAVYVPGIEDSEDPLTVIPTRMISSMALQQSRRRPKGLLLRQRPPSLNRQVVTRGSCSLISATTLIL